MEQLHIAQGKPPDTGTEGLGKSLLRGKGGGKGLD